MSERHERADDSCCAPRATGNIISVSQIQKIGAALAFNTVLQSLNLSGLISVGPSGARTIAASLKENRTLSKLNLDNTKVGDEGAIALADMLRTNCTLTDLALGGNGIRAQGAIAMAAGLEQNKGLVKINLAHNQIGADSATSTDAAVGALATAIEKNKTIRTFLLNRASRRERRRRVGNARGDDARVTLTSPDSLGNSICHEFRSTLLVACDKNNASGGVIEYFSVGDTSWCNAPASAIAVPPVEVTQAWAMDPTTEPFLGKAGVAI